MASIFISIISQDEDFLYQTIESCIENSSGKNDIYFGVIDQRMDGQFKDISKFPNIRFKQIKTTPRGVGIPRNESMSLYINEDYILIMDAHSIFQKFWDENLIRRHRYIEDREGVEAVISQHLPASIINYDKLSDVDLNQSSKGMYFDGLVIRDYPLGEKDYDAQYPVTCQFIFGRSKILSKVDFDPDIYYLAEESILSLKIYATGARVFAINYNPMSHLVKPLSKIKNDWRNKVDPERMSNDFDILFEVFCKKNIKKYSSISKSILNSFISDSSIDMSCVFKNLNLSLDDNEKVKKEIYKVVSTNDFDTSVFFIIGKIASVSNTNQ